MQGGSDVPGLHLTPWLQPLLGEHPPGQQPGDGRLASCVVTEGHGGWPLARLGEPYLHVGDAGPQRISHPGHQVLCLLL